MTEFCDCKMYREVSPDMCECGHDIDDHIHQVISGCGR